MKICKWDGLPDARDPQTPHGKNCRVTFDEKNLAYFVERQLLRARAHWEEWLSENLCLRLVQWYYKEIELTPELSDQLCQQFRQQVEAALCRPLVLIQELSAHSSVWTLVGPCGAVFHVRAQDKQLMLTNAYYVRPSLWSRPARRWRSAVQHLVWRYCELRELGGCLVLTPAASSNLRWVHLETWGFDTSGPMPIWRGRLGSWPAAEKLSSPEPLRRIKLRKRQWTLAPEWDDSEFGIRKPPNHI
ncbi:MAG: hypothetical protein RMI91_12350 [Gemmatales bacterium]|nr:hypothetical protein [Gemmatales bacterium]MDW7995432.1 hypothetical protein [Gemmatales bacterium]